MPLYLLPNLLESTAKPEEAFVPHLYEIVNSCDGFLAEHPKEARLFLKHFDFKKLSEKPMLLFNKESQNFEELLKPLLKGERWGVISDSGQPCIADPGAKLVAAARARGIEVVAHVGPCSIILALMLSGLNGQRFIFQGYMPRLIDKHIRMNGITQLFIETPYNNQKSLQRLLEVLPPTDIISVAADLTLPTQEVITATVKEWYLLHKKHNFHKRPAIFLLYSA